MDLTKPLAHALMFGTGPELDDLFDTAEQAQAAADRANKTTRDGRVYWTLPLFARPEDIEARRYKPTT